MNAFFLMMYYKRGKPCKINHSHSSLLFSICKMNIFLMGHVSSILVSNIKLTVDEAVVRSVMCCHDFLSNNCITEKELHQASVLPLPPLPPPIPAPHWWALILKLLSQLEQTHSGFHSDCQLTSPGENGELE